MYRQTERQCPSQIPVLTVRSDSQEPPASTGGAGPIPAAPETVPSNGEAAEGSDPGAEGSDPGADPDPGECKKEKEKARDQEDHIVHATPPPEPHWEKYN